MGRVVDPSQAFLVCNGFKLDDELMLYSKGVVGTLTDSQEKLCRRTVLLEPVPPGLVRRHKRFTEIAHRCSEEARKYPKGERLEPYLSCMGREGKEFFE